MLDSHMITLKILKMIRFIFAVCGLMQSSMAVSPPLTTTPLPRTGTSGTVYTLQANLTGYIPDSGFILQIITSRSSADCGALCSMTSNCTVFFYDSLYNMCQLHPAVPVDFLSMTLSPTSKCFSIQEEQHLLSRCPNGTFSFNNGEICYIFDDSMSRNFTDSLNYCLFAGMTIAKIDTPDQNLFLKSILSNGAMNFGYFIGLNDILVPNDYRWSDMSRSAPSYTDWGAGQPEVGPENCVEMYRSDNWRWHGTDCHENNNVICQF